MLILYSCTDRECVVCVTEDVEYCSMREFYFFFQSLRFNASGESSGRNGLIRSMFAHICTVTLLWLGSFTVSMLSLLLAWRDY